MDGVSNEYRFSDFTRFQYRELIQIAKRKFEFKRFSEGINEKTPCILWRHDVDISMHSALKLARIEKEEGVKSTFFLMLHCEFYNLLEREILDIVSQIEALGHEIGLHFDCDFYGITNEAQLEKYLSIEKRIFKDLLNVEVKAFSFHNPSLNTMTYEAEYYDGLINAYSSKIKSKFSYCSDSNGYWRHQRLHDFLISDVGNYSQVLTHPAWWQDKAMSPFERIKRSVEGRKEKNLTNYQDLLSNNGRHNVK